MNRKASYDELDRSPLHMMHRASQGADDLLQVENVSLDLTPRQYAVLEMLSKNEGASQRVLVDATGIDRSTMADIIQRMLKKGFVKRRRSAEDARAYSVKITEQGLQALKATKPIMRRIDERLLAPLSPRRAEEFVDSLVAIVAAFNKDEPKEDRRKRKRTR